MDFIRRVVSTYRGIFAENRKWMQTVIGWFVIGVVLGGIVAYFANPDIFNQIARIFEQKFGPQPAMDFNLVMGIFYNNLVASAVALFGGLLVGLGPFLVVISNGFLLGYILVIIPTLAGDGSKAWTSFGLALAGLIPHGIFEIPAFLLASALGLKLGLDWLKKENYGHRLSVLGNNFKKVLLLIPAIGAILFVAAIIEVYVSGNIVNTFGK